MKEYIHKVQYYETDKMGITHHSNYIKWMEEARVEFLEDIGFGYDKLEKDGIISPVIGVNCEYKKNTTFNDKVLINVEVEEFKGARLVIKYIMKNKDTGNLVLIGTSEHCFVDNKGIPIRINKNFPELDRKLKELANKKRNDIDF